MLRKKWNTSGILLLAVLLLCTQLTVFAEGNTGIAIDNTSPTVGDTFKVTVTGDSSSYITVTYDSSILTLTNCSAPGYAAEGNTVTFQGTQAALTFDAKASGTSGIVVASDTLTGSSVNVNVGGGANTDENTDENTEDDTADEEVNDVEITRVEDAQEGDFVIDGVAYVISERFTNEEIPDGFEEISLTIHGGTYRELSNGVLTLLYLKPADNIEGSGTFYIYNEEADDVSPFFMVGDTTHYVICLGAEAPISERFTATALAVNEQEVPSYQVEGVESDFYYIYGTNEAGEEGWYVYDSANGQVARADVNVLSQLGAASVSAPDEPQVQEPVEEKHSGFANRRLLIAIGIFAAALLVVVIINIVLMRRSRGEEDEEEDADDEDIEKEEISTSVTRIEDPEDAGIASDYVSVRDILEGKTKSSSKEASLDSLLESVVQSEAAKEKDTAAEKAADRPDEAIPEAETEPDVSDEEEKKEETAAQEAPAASAEPVRIIRDEELDVLDLNDL